MRVSKLDFYYLIFYRKNIKVTLGPAIKTLNDLNVFFVQKRKFAIQLFDKKATFISICLYCTEKIP